MSVTIFDAAVDGAQGTRITPIADFRKQIAGGGDRIAYHLQGSGNVNAGTCTVDLSNDNVTWTTHATITDPVDGTTFNLLGDYIRVDGSANGAAATLVLTLA